MGSSQAFGGARPKTQSVKAESQKNGRGGSSQAFGGARPKTKPVDPQTQPAEVIKMVDAPAPTSNVWNKTVFPGKIKLTKTINHLKAD